MKLFCNPLEISEALSVVSRALPVRSDYPILEYIKIEAIGDTITLSATNLEFYIKKSIKAEILIEGVAVVKGRVFVDFINKLVDNTEIEIETDAEKFLFVRYSDNKSEFPCGQVDTFPLMKQVEDEISYKIKEKELKKLLEKTVFCVATDDSRPALKGVFLEMNENSITAVAIDGYRLALTKCNINDVKGNVNTIISGKTLLELNKILSDTEEEIEVKIQSNNIVWNILHTVIYTRLIDSKYINYKAIIPTTNSTLVTVKTKELVTSLERINIVAKTEMNNNVMLTINNNNIAFSCKNIQGNIQESVTVTQTGNDIVTAMNIKYLIEALRKITTEYVNIAFNTATSPVVISSKTEDETAFVILPLRVIG